MKPYLLFAGEDYYPDGGVNDLKADFDTLAEAKQAGEAFCAPTGEKSPDGWEFKRCAWWQVVLHATMEEVASGQSPH